MPNEKAMKRLRPPFLPYHARMAHPATDSGFLPVECFVYGQRSSFAEGTADAVLSCLNANCAFAPPNPPLFVLCYQCCC